MSTPRIGIGLLTLAAALTATGARAGIYNPAEKPALPPDPDRIEQPLFEPGEDGVMRPMPFAQFQLQMGRLIMLQQVERGELRNIPENAREAVSRLHKVYAERVRERSARGADALGEEEFVGLTADLIRLGRLEEALNHLGPAARARRASFRVLSHLAWASFLSGQSADALGTQQAALSDAEFPRELEGYSPEHLRWYRELERKYVRKLIRLRAAAGRPGGFGGGADAPDALFDEPVNFVGPGGSYEAGTIAEEEGAKLPPDAIAVVQQLLLWAPGDSRLYWLLAELYNARGEIETARNIFDELTFSRGFQNEVLLEHRRVVQAAVDAKQAAAAAARADAARSWMPEGRQVWVVGGLAAVVVAVLTYWQVREFRRRLARRPRSL